jgi:hypothetical protein
MRRADLSSRGILSSVVCLSERDFEASIMRRPWPAMGISCYEKLNTAFRRGININRQCWDNPLK